MAKPTPKIILATLAIAVFAGFSFAWYITQRSLNAEHTHGAYRTTMLALEEYLESNPDSWPKGWNDLLTTNTAQQHSTSFEKAPERITIHFDVPVTWKQNPQLTEGIVQLRFNIRNADVFSFRFE